MSSRPLAPRRFFTPQRAMLLAVILGVGCGLRPLPYQQAVAQGVLLVFMNALRLVSLPIIFLAVCTTIMGMPSLASFAQLGRRIVTYTALTTVLAAAVALALFLSISPTLPQTAAVGGAAAHVVLAPGAVESDGGSAAPAPQATYEGHAGSSYLDHLAHLIPDSLFAPFIEGNVTAVLLLSVAFGLAMLQVPERHKVAEPLTAALAGLLKIIRVVTLAVPLVVWAGIVGSFAQLSQKHTALALARYLLVVVAANLLQASVVLPALLRLRGVRPLAAVRAFLPALQMAFFSKSSVATLPVAMRCAEEVRKLPPALVRFSFPLCTSINMNGCAAFILSTVLFVAKANGLVFSPLQLVGWIFLASLAALGNAGVPMGCYVLTCALLGTMNVPLQLMTLILPFYGFVDMLETAVNVWSDACVTMLVDRDLAAETPTNAAVAVADATSGA